MRLERILVLESPCYVHIDTQRLAIERDTETGKKTNFVALIDIGGVLLDTPRVVITTGALQALAEFGVPVVLSGVSHLPTAMLMPHANHTATVTRHRAQASIKDSLKKALWAKIVKAKITNQAKLLAHYGFNKPLARLERLAQTVQSGDPHNHEAQAAIYYWQACFGQDFKRDKPQAEDTINRSLNYGYAIVRALIARYVALAGLNAAFGCGHINTLNPLCLVDDLIEPFRSSIDTVVLRHILPMSSWDRTAKVTLLKVLDQNIGLKNAQYRLTSAAYDVVQSYVDAILQQDVDALQMPSWFP